MYPISERSRKNDDRLECIRASTNTSISTTQKFNISFLLFFVYTGILAASTTDYDLLIGTVTKIPLLDIELSILGIYAVIPVLIVLCHLSLFIYLYQTSQRVHRYCTLLKDLVIKNHHEYLLQLNVFPPAQMLFGCHFKGSSKFFDKMLFVVFNIITPLVLLLFIQIRFLPYHHHYITQYVHRFAVLLDATAILIFLPKIYSVSGRWSDWLHYRIKSTSVVWPRKLQKSLFLFALFFPVILSVSVFTLPGEGVERIMGFKWATEILCDSRCAPFHRNLNLQNEVLVREPPPLEIQAKYEKSLDEYEIVWKKYTKGLMLKNRDFRFANFTGSNLINADLSDSNLQGATLRETKLINANLSGTKLDGADLVLADLRGANMRSTRAIGALFGKRDHSECYGADLRGANLTAANLNFASMIATRAEGANMQYANLLGTSWYLSNLKATKFAPSFLIGADFENADLRGANFHASSLGGASFKNADLRGASLYVTIISNTDFTNSNLQLTDFRGVRAESNAEGDHAILVEHLYEAKKVFDEGGLLFSLEKRKEFIDIKKSRLPKTIKIATVSANDKVLYNCKLNTLYADRLNINVLSTFGWACPCINVNDYECELISYLIELSKTDVYVASGLSLRCDTQLSNRYIWPNLIRALTKTDAYKNSFIYPCTHEKINLEQLLKKTPHYTIQYYGSDCLKE